MGPLFFLFALILMKITNYICSVRVTEDVEKADLDISHHGETIPGVELKPQQVSSSAVVTTVDDLKYTKLRKLFTN